VHQKFKTFSHQGQRLAASKVSHIESI